MIAAERLLVTGTEGQCFEHQVKKSEKSQG